MFWRSAEAPGLKRQHTFHQARCWCKSHCRRSNSFAALTDTTLPKASDCRDFGPSYGQ
jgi:hypothetical protein